MSQVVKRPVFRAELPHDFATSGDVAADLRIARAAT
jgi:hypothetical protein